MTARVGLILLLASAACRPAPAPACSLDDHARAYVDLVAAMARRDPRSVDSPPPPSSQRLSAGLLVSGARDLRHHLVTSHHRAADRLRVAGLLTQLNALEARAEQVSGARLTYQDEMVRLLGDPPVQPWTGDTAATEADAALEALDALLPGSGSLATRVAAFDRRLTVPPDRLPAVLTRALAVCRQATLRHIHLPAGERLDVSFADGGTWSGFSRYHGNGRSTMAVNPRYPLSVGRVLDLSCHEGYPGHHVINLLRDHHLVREHGRHELGIALTFSPPSYAAEALASAAPALVFSHAERIQVVRDELMPLARLDRSLAARHVEVDMTLLRLDAATAATTHAYLTGEIGRNETLTALRVRSAMDEPSATLQFIDEYRAYSTAYTAGRLLAMRLLGPEQAPEEQWRRFVELALQPQLAAR